MKTLLILFLPLSIYANCNYPEHWWKKAENPSSWEISPHTAIKNKEVVLSKRNELGILSNFAPTPFVLDGKKYASLEGFWQALKFPDEKLKGDIRKEETYSHTRSEVEQLSAFTAKKAGSAASKIMKKLGINWVSYQGEIMEYKTPKKAKHYKLIIRAMKAKYEQNPKVQTILKSTCNLKLLADHQVKVSDPPAWKYYKIWEQIRSGEL